MKWKKIIKKWSTNKILKLKNNVKRGTKKIVNFIKKIKKSGIKNFKKRKKFLQQVKQGYYICTICHWSLYQRSVRFFNHEKFQILTSEFYHSVKFDEKLCICEACHKHLYKNKIPCQAVCNKMALDPTPD